MFLFIVCCKLLMAMKEISLEIYSVTTSLGGWKAHLIIKIKLMIKHKNHKNSTILTINPAQPQLVL